MRTRPFRIALDHVMLLEDVAGGFVVCLGVSRGRAALVRLHDRLYAGPLAPCLRTDIAFEPHLTLGRRRRVDAANRLAAEISAAEPDIRAPVETFRLIELGTKAAIPGRRFRLRG
jgi:2'-5' RNA ligase